MKAGALKRDRREEGSCAGGALFVLIAELRTFSNAARQTINLEPAQLAEESRRPLLAVAIDREGCLMPATAQVLIDQSILSLASQQSSCWDGERDAAHSRFLRSGQRLAEGLYDIDARHDGAGMCERPLLTGRRLGLNERDTHGRTAADVLQDERIGNQVASWISSQDDPHDWPEGVAIGAQGDPERASRKRRDRHLVHALMSLGTRA